MTRHAPPTRAHLLIGQPDEVRAALTTAHAQGRLLRLGPPATLVDGRVSIPVELTDPPPPPPLRVPGSGLRPWLIGAGVLAGLGAAAGVVWLLVAVVVAVIGLVTAAVAWITAHLLLIGLALAALALLCGGGSTCAGLHCGGCRR